MPVKKKKPKTGAQVLLSITKNVMTICFRKFALVPKLIEWKSDKFVCSHYLPVKFKILHIYQCPNLPRKENVLICHSFPYMYVYVCIDVIMSQAEF